MTRYGGETRGGEISWKVRPQESVAGRVVLVVDDILDEGQTLAAIRTPHSGGRRGRLPLRGVRRQGHRPARSRLRADFVGVRVPDRYVFGFGMDVYGAWRNLPAIYALPAT